MKRNKCLIFIAFLISSFLFINYVKAENYTAKVTNPSGAKCDLRDGSTGYCYYKDKNLNNYVSGVVWLDNGDEVTIITDSKDHPNIATNNPDVCKDYYVYTSFYFNKTAQTYYGYYCNANLATSSLTDELKDSLKNSGFPESYWEDLAFLKTIHPNWTFKAIDTKLDFSDVVNNQLYGSRSLIRKSMSNNYAYLDYGEISFDYYKDKYIAYDDTTGSDPWYKANYDTIAYYIDPRNFLSDMYIFQFQTLSYDSNIEDSKYKDSILNIFSNDYLANFVDDFVTAGKESLVTPIYLASLSKQEVTNGSTAGVAINGAYNGMYNFYNIGATGGADPVYRGLQFAANTDELTLRPWNTEYKAIVGGAKWIYTNYVYPGQDTSYFKKYNVVRNYLLSIGREPTYLNYTNQYMQNITAPSSEATTTYHSYYNTGLIDLSYTFYIPVYQNMPDTTSLPNSSRGGWPNNYLSSLSINGNKVAGFDGGVETYNYNLDINNPNIKIDAKAVNGNTKIDGLGTFEITENTVKEIKVTAQNGNVKTYKINVTLTGNKLDKPVDVVTTLNNAGIKNGDIYLSGFKVGSDINFIKERIVSINKEANIIIKNNSGEDKNSGVMKTGDTAIITIGNDTKKFEIVIYGDVNGDGKISAGDYVKIKNQIMGTSTLSGAYIEAADVNKDGKASAGDYVKIKNQIMGAGTIEQ